MFKRFCPVLICATFIFALFSKSSPVLASIPSSTNYYHSGHLGSNIAITDATSTVEWDRVYLLYGQEFNDPNFDHIPNTHQDTEIWRQDLKYKFFYFYS